MAFGAKFHRSRCDTHHLSDFMGIQDELKDRIELLELGGCLRGLQGCFESPVHGHGILNVLTGGGLLSVTRSRKHEMLNLHREKGLR